MDRSSRFRLLRSLFSSLVCASAFCGGSAFAQDAPAPAETTFHSDAAEVRVTFSTTDQNGRVMATVEAGDFAIVDQDLVVRDFRSFTRSEYTRLDVAVLVDASGSMTQQFHRELASVVQLIAHSEGAPDGSFSVVSFRGLNPSLVCDGDLERDRPVLGNGQRRTNAAI